MTMNGTAPHERSAHEYPITRFGRGRSYEDDLTCAAYMILAAVFGVGILAGVVAVFVVQWIW